MLNPFMMTKKHNLGPNRHITLALVFQQHAGGNNSAIATNTGCALKCTATHSCSCLRYQVMVLCAFHQMLPVQ